MSDQLVWYFGTSAFYPVDTSRMSPRFQREPRVEVFNLIGTGLAEFNVYGYGEYRMECQALVLSKTAAEALEAAQGTVAVLDMGGAQVSDVMLMRVELRARADHYFEGTLQFARSGSV